jgi:hypothetical protein
MAKTRFGAGETPAETPVEATVVVAPETSQAVAVVPPVGLPAPAKNNFVLGDYLPSFDQVVLPRVNVAQNIGQLQDTFDPGTIVLARQTVLFLPPDIDMTTGTVKRAATPPCVMTVLGFRKTRFVEKTKGGAKGLIVNSEQDVVKAGGTLDYGEWKLKEGQIKRFEPLVDACVLIQRPEGCEDDDSVFVHEIDNQKYALALWSLKGTLYTSLAKGVWFTARKMGCLMSKEVKKDGKGTGVYTGGYPTWSYNIVSKEKQFSEQNRSWIVTGTPHKKNSEVFLDAVRDILEPPPQS